MDLLGDEPILDLTDDTWRIYARHSAETPQYIGAEAVVENSSVTEGCTIYGTVINSVLASDVVVEKGAVVKDSVIMDDVRICEGAVVNYSIVDEHSVIEKNAKVGEERGEGVEICVIPARSTVGGDK